MDKKTLNSFGGEARNTVHEFKKLVAAFCGVEVDDVQIRVEVKKDENKNRCQDTGNTAVQGIRA